MSAVAVIMLRKIKYPGCHENTNHCHTC